MNHWRGVCNAGERLPDPDIRHYRGCRHGARSGITSTIGRVLRMWTLLKKTDIEQAKQDLKLRHTQILRKHAEETQSLDTERIEVEILNNLLEIFALKFMNPRISSHKPIPAPVVSAPVAAAPAVPAPFVPAAVVPAPVAPVPMVHEPVVHQKARTKLAEGDHRRNLLSPTGFTQRSTVKATDHIRGAKAHGASPAAPHEQRRLSQKDPGGGRSRETQHHNKHKYPRTNFEVFSRAIARELALE